MKLKSLSVNPAYRDFTHARDRALEKILHVHLSAIDVVLGKLKRKVLSLAHLQPWYMEREFRLAAAQVTVLAERLRRQARLLAHTSEAHVLAQILNRKTRVQPSAPKVEMPSGGSVQDRIHLAFSRLKRKVDDAIQLSQTLGDTHTETVERIGRAFPPNRGKPKATPALSRRKLAREARSMFKPGIIETDDWENILEDYNAEQLPSSIYGRGPEDDVLFYDVDSSEFEVRYQWEVEQEITEDFVHQVREGTHEAAKENGISDFQWIAVIDSHTDECCSVRDGLTSEEIEERMDSGEIDDDLCDAIVAPAHFNCRCKSEPMSDDVPEESPPDFEEFDDWLKDKAAA